MAKDGNDSTGGTIEGDKSQASISDVIEHYGQLLGQVDGSVPVKVAGLLAQMISALHRAEERSNNPVMIPHRDLQPMPQRIDRLVIEASPYNGDRSAVYADVDQVMRYYDTKRDREVALTEMTPQQVLQVAVGAARVMSTTLDRLIVRPQFRDLMTQSVEAIDRLIAQLHEKGVVFGELMVRGGLIGDLVTDVRMVTSKQPKKPVDNGHPRVAAGDAGATADDPPDERDADKDAADEDEDTDEPKAKSTETSDYWLRRAGIAAAAAPGGGAVKPARHLPAWSESRRKTHGDRIREGRAAAKAARAAAEATS